MNWHQRAAVHQRNGLGSDSIPSATGGVVLSMFSLLLFSLCPQLFLLVPLLLLLPLTFFLSLWSLLWLLLFRL
jgi:hypothetical protein